MRSLPWQPSCSKTALKVCNVSIVNAENFICNCAAPRDPFRGSFSIKVQEGGWGKFELEFLNNISSICFDTTPCQSSWDRLRELEI